MEYCNNCEFRKKKKFTTLFECKKYDVILKGNPPEKYEKCKNEQEKPKTRNKRDKYIEVE